MKFPKFTSVMANDIREVHIPEADDLSDQKKDSEESWRWLVLLGAFFIYVCLAMQINLFGLLYRDIMLSAKVSTTIQTLIFNTFMFNLELFSLFAGPLCERFGFRPISFTCGIILGLSSLASALIPIPELLFLTYSLLAGMVCGMFFAIPQCILPLYFRRRVGFAMGVLFTGLTTGQLVGPLLLATLRKEYGRYAPLLISALLFNTCVAALTFVPPMNAQGALASETSHQHRQDSLTKRINERNGDNDRKINSRRNSFTDAAENPESIVSESITTSDVDSDIDLQHYTARVNVRIMKAVLVNLKLLRYYRVLIISFSFSLLFVAQLNFIVLIPYILNNSNYSMELVTWGYTVLAVCNFIPRLVVPTLSDYLPISKRWYTSLGSLVTCSSLILHANVSTPSMILLSLGMLGFSLACTMPFQSLSIIEFMGVKSLPATLGANGFIMAFIFIIVGPVTGAIRDSSGSYVTSLYFLATLCCISALLWLLMPLALRFDNINLKKQSTVNQ